MFKKKINKSHFNKISSNHIKLRIVKEFEHIGSKVNLDNAVTFYIKNNSST